MKREKSKNFLVKLFDECFMTEASLIRRMSDDEEKKTNWKVHLNESNSFVCQTHSDTHAMCSLDSSDNQLEAKTEREEKNASPHETSNFGSSLSRLHFIPLDTSSIRFWNCISHVVVLLTLISGVVW